MSLAVMKLLILFAAIVGVFSATLDDEWAMWKSRFSKVYEDEATESVRRIVWENNWQFVQQHNSEGHSFEVEMNEFADLVSVGHMCGLADLVGQRSVLPHYFIVCPQTAEEFAKIYLSKINMANTTGGGSKFPFTGKEAVPDTLDWRTKGIVTPIKNQV